MYGPHGASAGMQHFRCGVANRPFRKTERLTQLHRQKCPPWIEIPGVLQRIHDIASRRAQGDLTEQWAFCREIDLQMRHAPADAQRPNATLVQCQQRSLQIRIK